jgi:N6-L-threonylcarbamoyladenine synthase
MTSAIDVAMERLCGCDAYHKKRNGCVFVGNVSSHNERFFFIGILGGPDGASILARRVLLRYSTRMRILGIETSCDETAVTVIEAEGSFGPEFRYSVLGSALYSQIAVHAPYGGVFPNLAKREHAKNLVPLMEEALRDAHLLYDGVTQYEESIVAEVLNREHELGVAVQEFLASHENPRVDAVAVTYGPGLEPALWVGVNFAKALSIAWGVPLIAVNHMEGHIVLSMLEDAHLAQFAFPVLSLLISGGHTELVLSRSWLRYEIVGQTRDDAAGEAFDKVARMLGLPYPGGPALSRLAAEERARNHTRDIIFPRPMMHQDNFDFSFAGLKTEVRKYVGDPSALTEERRAQIACEFENAVADVLVSKTLRAADTYGAATIVVGGGVSANTYIREQLAHALHDQDASAVLLTPPPALAGDNALMIAVAGYFRAHRHEYADPQTLCAQGNLRLA